MARRVTRKLELYSIHAHNISKYSYDSLFRSLYELRPDQRVVRIRGLVFGIPVVLPLAEGYFLQILEGDPDATTLILDSNTGEANESTLSEGEILSQATHLIISPAKRLAAVEYVRRGSKATQVGPAIAGILRKQAAELRDLNIELAPKLTKSFSNQISAFERIRIASLRVTRPNASWTDHYTDLSELMEDSGGEKAELDVRAGRGESLEKEKGIVKVIKEIADDEHPYIEEASITGTRKNESAETVVRSSTHTVHARVNVAATSTGEVFDNSIRDKLSAFIAAWL